MNIYVFIYLYLKNTYVYINRCIYRYISATFTLNPKRFPHSSFKSTFPLWLNLQSSPRYIQNGFQPSFRKRGGQELLPKHVRQVKKAFLAPDFFSVPISVKKSRVHSDPLKKIWSPKSVFYRMQNICIYICVYCPTVGRKSRSFAGKASKDSTQWWAYFQWVCFMPCGYSSPIFRHWSTLIWPKDLVRALIVHKVCLSKGTLGTWKKQRVGVNFQKMADPVTNRTNRVGHLQSQKRKAPWMWRVSRYAKYAAELACNNSSPNKISWATSFSDAVVRLF